MTFNDRLKAMRKGHDEEMVTVTPPLPTRQAQEEWARWLSRHQGCKFSDNEIIISTGRAKSEQGAYDIQWYAVKRGALKREGITA